MDLFKKHIILTGTSIHNALKRLEKLSKDAIVFVVDENGCLKGSLTDGDIRRKLIKGISIENPVDSFIQTTPHFIRKGDNNIDKIIEYRNLNFRAIPILDKKDRVVNIINFRKIKSYLPIDVLIMAGGRGERMRPLTDITPKPLLKIGNKPILEHNIDRIKTFGIYNFWISVKYLGEKIENYFQNGSEKEIKINYVWEDQPLGTIGAISKIKDFQHEYIMVANSDILTDLNYELFFLDFIKYNADFAVVTIPYKINIPYAVLETNNGNIESFKEKPTYTYYSNGGIYLMKKKIIDYIPKEKFYNATDLMEDLIKKKKKVVSYPLSSYWLDIGKHEDYNKAQKDIHNINLK